jgi:hypothetical protein
MLPAETTPALVTNEEPPEKTNPEPLRTTVKLPLVAVGMTEGDMLAITAPGDLTVRLIATTTFGDPFVGAKVTVPVRTAPGAAVSKTDVRKVTGIGALPKL